MTLKPMYPAIVNSPGTELAAEITATATEINVLSTNGLPPAPNLLTLGSDETAETVRYTKIDGTKLTVERGFQGVAKSWSAGTRVARYFTAYDHDTFIENIGEIEAETADAKREDLTLNVGLQIVESAQDTPFQFGDAQGCTRINLNGKDGNFDYRGLLPTFFGTGEIVPSSGPISTKAMKVVCNRTDTAHFGARYELEIDRSKHYIAVAYMDNVSCDAPVYFSIAEMKDTGYTSLRLSAKIAKGSGMQYLYATISPAQMENREKLVYYFRGEGTSGAEFRIGPFAFYEITAAEYDAISTMTPEQVAERYPYVDSMTNVKNPYAIVTGGNLLPPFTDGWSIASQATVVSPYHLRLTPESNYNGNYISIPCLPNTTYTLHGTVTGGGKLYGDVRGPGDSHEYHLATDGKVTFTTRADAAVIDVLCTNDTAIASDMEFIDVMLTIGTEPKPFVPQQRSTLAFETELAANPVDGSNSDTLFMGDDGLPYVLERWKKVTLEKLTWDYESTAPEFKRVIASLESPNDPPSFISKYSGQIIRVYIDGHWGTSPDAARLTAGVLYMTIANTDSGWGQDYNPTQDEIKAYFLGWKMYDATGADYNDPTGGMAKWWQKSDGKGGRVSGTQVSTVPTTLVTDTDWQPYRLQYLKAKPTVEPVRNYELGATLSSGSNMVEVGSGIVIREKANPVKNGVGDYAINANLPGNHLQNKVRSFIGVYANGAEVFDRVETTRTISNGTTTDISGGVYDPTAVYHVTYTMLDPTLAAPISGTVAANLRGTVSDLVQRTGDMERRLSVVENGKVEKAEPEWIKPTLLSGWTNYDTKLYSSAGYYKDGNGIVRIKGLVKGGPIQSFIFMLPAGHRPKTTLLFPAIDASYTSVRVDVTHNGEVFLNTAIVNTDYLSLDGISFLAEQ